MLIPIVYVIISLCLNFFNAEENNTKLFCHVKTNNFPGYCMRLRGCLSVYSDVKKGYRNYTVCHIPNQPKNQLHVCCPNSLAKDPNEQDTQINYSLNKLQPKKNNVSHFCRVKKNDMPGYCVSWKKCLSLYNDIKKGDKSFTSCNIPTIQSQKHLYVCCPDSPSKDSELLKNSAATKDSELVKDSSKKKVANPSDKMNQKKTNEKHFCRVEKSGWPGYCTSSRKCFSVHNDIKNGDRSFTTCQIPNQPKNQLYVCCPDLSAKKKLNDNPLTRIYQKKCKEYQEAAFVYIKSIPIPNERVVIKKKNMCVHKLEPLIIGGVQVKPREFPHMASLGFIEQIKNGDNTITNVTYWRCGGSLISERFVLTAAHCFYQNGASPKVVRVGELDFANNEEESDPEDILIDELIPHPNYIKGNLYNDIGLIRLQKNVKLNPFKRPACLPLIPTSKEVKKAIATGWGSTNKIGQGTTDKLLKVTLEKFAYDECSRVYDQFNNNAFFLNGIEQQTQICYGSHTESKDTCNGDSGGPLQLFVNHKDIYCMYEIIGVTSFGIKCGRKGIPGIYTKVDNYIDWIEKAVWGQEIA